MSKLYIVPTPIGNLEDMTFRAIRVLKEVDLILAEDTRTSGKLLKHFEISTHMHSHHMHNEHKTVENLIKRLQAGDNIALISDAGTPAISDPGFLLTRACVENNIEVDCLPGATAFVPALVNSGLPNDRFVFEGFLPEKKGRQTRYLALAEFVQYFGADRAVSVSRELSKLHEETIRGTAEEVLKHFEVKPPKGEIVAVVGGKISEEKAKSQEAKAKRKE